jgi:predicted metalloprotease
VAWADAATAPSKLNDALRVAKLIGDDFQQRASGRVVDSAMWTHGSSEQRQRWVTIGFESGRPNDCDTFAASRL